MTRPLLLVGFVALVAACSERTEPAETSSVGPGQSPAAGTPCPTTTPAVVADRGANLKHSSTINDVTLERQFGTASCQATTAGRGGRGATCDLSSPGVVHVTAEGAEHYFDIPVGVPATVTVSGGEVRCVLKQERTP